MSYVLDILEAILALAAMLGCVALLFSPFIAYSWCQRHNPSALADHRRGFPVILKRDDPK